MDISIEAYRSRIGRFMPNNHLITEQHQLIKTKECIPTKLPSTENIYPS